MPGTLHILFLIALADLKTGVRDMRIPDVNDVARLLRDPSSMYSSIRLLHDLTNGAPVDVSLSCNIGMIISAITLLHERVNLKLHTLLSQERCDALGVPEVISSNGVSDSDILFDDIQFM